LYGRGSAKGEMAGSMLATAFVAAATFDDAETDSGAKAWGCSARRVASGLKALVS